MQPLARKLVMINCPGGFSSHQRWLVTGRPVQYLPTSFHHRAKLWKAVDSSVRWSYELTKYQSFKTTTGSSHRTRPSSTSYKYSSRVSPPKSKRTLIGSKHLLGPRESTSRRHLFGWLRPSKRTATWGAGTSSTVFKQKSRPTLLLCVTVQATVAPDSTHREMKRTQLLSLLEKYSIRCHPSLVEREDSPRSTASKASRSVYWFQIR